MIFYITTSTIVSIYTLYRKKHLLLEIVERKTYVLCGCTYKVQYFVLVQMKVIKMKFIGGKLHIMIHETVPQLIKGLHTYTYNIIITHLIITENTYMYIHTYIRTYIHTYIHTSWPSLLTSY